MHKKWLCIQFKTTLRIEKWNLVFFVRIEKQPFDKGLHHTNNIFLKLFIWFSISPFFHKSDITDKCSNVIYKKYLEQNVCDWVKGHSLLKVASIKIKSFLRKNACGKKSDKNEGEGRGRGGWRCFYRYDGLRLYFAHKVVSRCLRVSFINILRAPFTAAKSQKHKKILKTWLNFYAFGICACNFHQHFTYEQLFCSKVFCTAFLYLQFGFVFFWQKKICTKGAQKMLVKLTLVHRRHIQQDLLSFSI